MSQWYAAINAMAVGLAASLVFLVQPFVGRLLTPRLGGGPYVWVVTMLFFQLALLGGYWGADLLRRMADHRWQRRVYLAFLIGSAALFAAFGSAKAMDGVAASWWSIVWTLCKTCGLPFVALSMASPLIQYWFAKSTSANPYRLYVASNAGSLLGLLAYPFVLSRYFRLETHRWFIVVGALGVVVLLGVTTFIERYLNVDSSKLAQANEEADLPGAEDSRPWLWTLVAFIPSSLMLGSTSFIANEVASVPLVWVGPLALYLVSMMIGFSGWLSFGRVTLTACVIACIVVGSPLALLMKKAIVGVHLVGFFVIASVFHTVVYQLRPKANDLTRYYGYLALGGALGGVFNGVVAPSVFDAVIEYRLILAVGATVLSLLFMKDGTRASRQFGFAWIMLVAITAVFFVPERNFKAQSRSFFGSYRVVEQSNGFRHLMHGSTNHGLELPAGLPRHAGYYVEEGPIGDIFAWAQAHNANTLVAGLGIGGISAYAPRVPHMTFIEIDPQVTEIARTWFGYLDECAERCSVVHGDARVQIAGSTDNYSLIIMDAYSSASMPVHLMTQEALELYLDKLAGGLLALHISNRRLNLLPVVARTAAAMGVGARTRIYAGGKQDWNYPSQWVVLSEDPRTLAFFDDEGWERLSVDGEPGWTDDFQDVVSAYRFGLN